MHVRRHKIVKHRSLRKTCRKTGRKVIFGHLQSSQQEEQERILADLGTLGSLGLRPIQTRGLSSPAQFAQQLIETQHPSTLLGVNRLAGSLPFASVALGQLPRFGWRGPTLPQPDVKSAKI